MAKPEMLLKTDAYTEGIVVAGDGTIYFSMTSQGTISRFRPGDKRADVWSHVPAPNGHAILSDGRHAVMSSAGALLELDESGRISRVVGTKIDGRWLVYPNDVAADGAGGYYVTDSGYKSTPKTVEERPQGRVYYVDPNRSVHPCADGLQYGNGIAISPGERHVFVGESTTRRIWRYRRDGRRLGGRDLFAEIPQKGPGFSVPDGMTTGPDGLLYVAHYGAREVLAYGSDGTVVRRLDAGNRAVSHVAFDPRTNAPFASGGLEGEDGPGAIFALNAV